MSPEERAGAGFENGENMMRIFNGESAARKAYFLGVAGFAQQQMLEGCDTKQQAIAFPNGARLRHISKKHAINAFPFIRDSGLTLFVIPKDDTELEEAVKLFFPDADIIGIDDDG